MIAGYKRLWYDGYILIEKEGISMKGTYLIVNPEERKAPAGGPPVGGPPAGGPPAGGPPAGGPPVGGPPAGGPPAGGMTPPANRETKLVWDGVTAVWTNEMGEEVTLDTFEASENELKFTAMAGPAPIEWTITKTDEGYTAVSHRGADIHGNPPVDTVCQVTKE